MMRIQDWVGLVVIITTVAGGALFIGQLSAEVRELRKRLDVEGPLEKVAEARDRAIEEVQAAGHTAVSESLRGEAVLEEYTWHQDTDNSAKKMLSTSEGICFLTRVSGRFLGDGEWLSVHPEDGQWIFDGGSAQVGVHGHARCWQFPWAD